jgi:predicted CopG family antitoxin
MELTTIPIKKETRSKLRQLARKSESWDDMLNRFYENEITIQNAQVFLSADTLSLDEALEEIKSW